MIPSCPSAFSHGFTVRQSDRRAFATSDERALHRLHLSAAHLAAACPLVSNIPWMLRQVIAPTHHFSSFNWNLAMAENTVLPDAPLTPTERRLWDALRNRAGKDFSRRELVALVMPGTIVEARTIDVHVVGLRKKLGRQVARIRTVWGQGYCYEA
jgi:DNA-binding response OmpR family regulator